MEGTRGWEIRVRTGRGVGRLESNRGLPIVDGRSSKHALSWQTPSWSWRTGCAPGDGLCASDGRGADYHQHPACHRVSIEGGKGKSGGRKENSHISEKHRGRRRRSPLLYHSPHRQRVLSTLPTSWVPSLWSELPTHPAWRSTAAAHRKTQAWPALPLSDAQWIKDEITYAFLTRSQSWYFSPLSANSYRFLCLHFSTVLQRNDHMQNISFHGNRPGCRSTLILFRTSSCHIRCVWAYVWFFHAKK